MREYGEFDSDVDSVLEQKYFFIWKIWSKKLKQSIKDKNWCLAKFKDVEVGRAVHLVCFRLEKHFLGKFHSKIKTCCLQ